MQLLGISFARILFRQSKAFKQLQEGGLDEEAAMKYVKSPKEATDKEQYDADKALENTEFKGSTKGSEFLLQNTLGYANKSDVNSKQELEVTEKVRIKQLSDEEVKSRLARLTPKIVQFTDINKAEAQ